jgi:cytochrome c oxidase assembly protein subunit 15
MALLGAVTRLTESGLSITKWDLVTGIVPPLNEAEWKTAFAAYQQIPQYQILHRGMSLAEFKGIFFWEWIHRLWGRLIGIVFVLPFFWFLAHKQIDGKLGARLGLLVTLGAVQGFIGWFMVESGLVVRTSVSPYRLALHLGFALLIYALILWTALEFLRLRPLPLSKNLRFHGWVALGFLSVTMLWGAFVAGLHAGEAYNSWPLMAGDVVPDAAFTLVPKWKNIFENLALVQFIHRWLGPVTLLVILSWIYRCRQATKRQTSRWFVALGVVALAQVTLGILTLLTHVNIALATLHQAGAITLLTLLLITLQKSKN